MYHHLLSSSCTTTTILYHHLVSSSCTTIILYHHLVSSSCTTTILYYYTSCTALCTVSSVDDVSKAGCLLSAVERLHPMLLRLEADQGLHVQETDQQLKQRTRKKVLLIFLSSYLLAFLPSCLLIFLCLSCIHILYILQKRSGSIYGALCAFLVCILSVSIWCFVCAFLVCILEKRSVSIYMVLCNRSKNHLWSVSHVFLTTNNLVVLLLFLHSSFGIDLGFLCSFACIYLSIYTYMCSCQHQYRYHFVLWLAMQR